MISKKLLDTLCSNQSSGVLATVIGTDNNGPARKGDRLLWVDGKLVAGTVGGGSNEQQVLDACVALTADKEIITINSFLPGILPSCGGTLQISLEKIHFGNTKEVASLYQELTLQQGDKLLLMGAGHVAREISWLAARNGFQIHIIDPRQELMQAENFPQNCQLSIQKSTDFLTEKSACSQDFIIIIGPDHATDLAILKQAIQTSAHYIGVMGSKKKIASFKKILTEKELWQKAADRIYAPIGLPISSRTPTEVAVSIVAELIQVRAQSSIKQ